MDVSALEWTITLTLTIGVLLFDVTRIARNPHEPSMKECGVALSFYVGAAILFGMWVTFGHGVGYGIDFYTGWLTEYSLSVDNLFVFIILLGALKVPRKYQQEALMVGIILALIFRGIFIVIGYQLIINFSWVFYFFGAFLIYTAYSLVRAHATHKEEHPEDNWVVTFAQRHLNVGREWHGLKPWYHSAGVRYVSPMVIVIIALGATDIMFALDSIPAIFGITQEPYLVFAANVFALMGLRQLYFLLGGLLERLVFLSLGLAFILAFIGVKLVLEALHVNTLPFINDGQPVHVPDIPSLLSLAVIITTLVITAVTSLAASRRTNSPTG